MLHFLPVNYKNPRHSDKGNGPPTAHLILMKVMRARVGFSTKEQSLQR